MTASPRPPRRSYWARRATRHGALALATGTLTAAVVALVPGKYLVPRVSLATAYVGLALMGLSLAIGPWNVLRGRPNPVSTDLRRDVGIWGGVAGLVHTVLGLQAHLGGRFWLYFVKPYESHRFGDVFVPRLDPFGFANYTGLGVTVLLAMLLALSNDVSLRRLGTARWKALQRWNYAAMLLVVLHGVAYQVIEKRRPPFVALFGALALATALVQAAGYRRARTSPGRRRVEAVAR